MRAAKVDWRTCPPEVVARARAFYEAYNANSGWLNYQGNRCPEWDGLNDAIRSHWCAVVIFAAATPAEPAEPAPRRRYVLTAKVGADDVDALEGAVLDLATQVVEMDRGATAETGPVERVSGGASCGSIVTLDIDRDVTHESYFAAIADQRRRRDALRAAVLSGPA